MDFLAGKLPGELPLNPEMCTISEVIPCAGLSAHRGNVPNTAFSEALTAEETDLDFGLSQQLPCLGV
jgi:hypothetical protein